MMEIVKLHGGNARLAIWQPQANRSDLEVHPTRRITAIAEAIGGKILRASIATREDHPRNEASKSAIAAVS